MRSPDLLDAMGVVAFFASVNAVISAYAQTDLPGAAPAASAASVCFDPAVREPIHVFYVGKSSYRVSFSYITVCCVKVICTVWITFAGTVATTVNILLQVNLCSDVFRGAILCTLSHKKISDIFCCIGLTRIQYASLDFHNFRQECFLESKRLNGLLSHFTRLVFLHYLAKRNMKITSVYFSVVGLFALLITK